MGAAKSYLLTHPPRVAEVAYRVAEEMRLSRREKAELVFAAVLSDLGMVGLAEEAWENPRPVLRASTRARVERHPERSERTVRAIPHFESVGELVRHHHEWWSGEGYPDGLEGEAIPLGSRILRLADTVCALGEVRPHRPALPRDRIHRLVRDGTGREFGPEVARAYLRSVGPEAVPSGRPVEFRQLLIEAAGSLLPSGVRPLSTDDLLAILGRVIDAKDRYTGGHSRRVANLATAVSDRLGGDGDFRKTVRAAGYLHDLGKLGVPVRVLAKRGPLEEGEWESVRSHAGVGAAILREIRSLEHLADGARHHHERWDGGGYPDGLRGKQIPVLPRILAVCDAYDAMTSSRAYRPALSHDTAVHEIARCAGRQFGPGVTDAFLSLSEEQFATEPRTDREEAGSRWGRARGGSVGTSFPGRFPAAGPERGNPPAPGAYSPVA